MPLCWSLGMQLMERSFDPAVFTKNRQQLLEHRADQQLFDGVVLVAHQRDEHFTMDSTLLEGAASRKRFKSRDADSPPMTVTQATPRWTLLGSDGPTPRTRARRTQRCHGRRDLRTSGVAVQGKCPFKRPASMSLGQAAMVSDDDVAGAAR